MAQNTLEAWLTELGLPQYTDLFEENGIDFDVLGELTGEHLKEMGVSVLGHRLKLTKAIAALVTGAPAPDTVEQSKPSDALSNVATAERRHLTIMFCDLVGSTALSARLDPEDYRDVMTLYQETVSNVVTKAGGHVAKYLGDGVLIYFGYPIAQEDAAERACRAGFEIIEAIAGLKTAAGEKLQVRIGVATGVVVVGDLYGDGVEETSAVSGETPNLAARLQGLAQSGQMVIGNKTHDLLGDMFVSERLDNLELKGFEPGRVAWRVISEAQTQERFTLSKRRANQSPLVGRDTERTQLLAAWDEVKSGKGRLVLVTGEAGIGKSRLSHEVIDRATQDDAELMHYQAAHYFVNTALYPIRRQVETTMGFTAQDSDDDKLDKLESLVRSETNLDEARALMASLLSLPVDRYPPLNLSPALQKTRTIAMLVEQFVLRAQEAPLLVHFEDLHWIDPTSLDLLHALVQAMPDHPILLLATCRPEFRHDWDTEHSFQLALSRLQAKDIEALLDDIAQSQGRSISKAQRAQLLERSDGVPLFAEELTRFVMDTAPNQRGGAVPESLQDSLMARLDKLGATRELAQIGSAIGREFDIDLLSLVTGRSPADVAESMVQLIKADLVIATPDNSAWVFRHALLQEAAYLSMLRRRRQDLHGKIAETLENSFPERCARGPEQIANHLVNAGQEARSVPYWLTAGKTAWSRASMKEALAHLGHGLEFVDKIENPSERAKQELQLQSTMGVVQFAATSYASEQARDAFERAQVLFEDVDDVDLRVAVLYGIGAYETMKGDVSAGHKTFTNLAREVKASGNARYEVYSASMQAWSHFNRGNYAQTVHHATRVLDLYDAGAWDQSGPRLSAADPKVISECFRAAALWSLGQLDTAEQVGNDLIAYTRDLPDPYSLVYALSNGVIRVLDWNGNWDPIMSLTEECSKIAGEYGYGFLGLWGSVWRARAMARMGQIEEAEQMTAKVVAACKGAGVHYHRVSFETGHARQLLALDRIEDAAKVITELDAALDASGELNHAIELSLVKGELAHAQGNTNAAERAYLDARDRAGLQSALGWQLRAALGLASLTSDQEEKHQLVHPVYDQFTEGFDTRFMVKAKSLLDATTPAEAH